MNTKTSIQMIADALGLSRNTVSKVINNKPVPNLTRERVIKKAIEFGYKGFSQVKQTEIRRLKLLLLAGKPLSNLDFFISLVKGVENLATTLNVDFFQYTINPNTSFEQLRNYISTLKIDGIIVIELYDEGFLDRFLSLQLPIVFIDAAFGLKKHDGNYDVMLMESRDLVHRIAKEYLKNGYKEMVYCGDYQHCQGFYERFLGLRDAFSDYAIPIALNNQLIFSDQSPYDDPSWLAKKIIDLKIRPRVIFCANDFIAINTCKAIQYLKLRIPEDIQIIGFDNIVDSNFNIPSITTINVNKELLGQEALYVLIDRINRPNNPSRTIYFKTELIARGSTRIQFKNIFG
jgi:LacI family transcriptional regulator